MRLEVECLQSEPHQFIVTDVINDVEWRVDEEADGQLSINERPDATDYSDSEVMAAIKRGWSI